MSVAASAMATTVAAADREERGGVAPKRKEIYTYTAPWLIYGMNWSVRPDQPFRLAIGSFEEEYARKPCPPWFSM